MRVQKISFCLGLTAKPLSYNTKTTALTWGTLNMMTMMMMINRGNDQQNNVLLVHQTK